jgi:ATP-dependent RNA helicase DDX46/PRP5
LGGDSQTSLAADAKVAEAVAKAKEAEGKRQLTFAASAAQEKAAALARQFMSSKAGSKPAAGVTVTGDDEKRAFSAEIEINDYPQHARWKVTHKGALDAIIDLTECAVTTKGGFIQPGRNPAPGERKLHLLIEGNTDMDVQRCRTEIMRMLEEAAADSRPETAKYAKYSVV